MAAKIIAVMSPKGGVGKTTVSVNIATALASIGKRVLIVDANMDTSHVAVHYGFVEFPVALQDVLNNTQPVERAIYNHYAFGIDILPSRVFKVTGDKNAGYKLINLFYHVNKLLEKYDFIVLDSRPAVELDFLKMISNANIILVATPEITSLLEGKRLASECNRAGLNVLGMVLNRVNRKAKGAIGAKEAEKTTGVSILGEIPEDDKMYESLMSGTPVVLLDKRSKISKAFFDIARRLAS